MSNEQHKNSAERSVRITDAAHKKRVRDDLEAVLAPRFGSSS
jgi:hypothetical protein